MELDSGDALHFRLANGEVRGILLQRTYASVFHTTRQSPNHEKPGAVTDYCFAAALGIKGRTVSRPREVATPQRFYGARGVL